MTYQPLHRRPRWHDRPRAWLAAALHWLSGTLGDAPELADDNGEPISDLFSEPELDGPVFKAARLGDGTLLRLDGEPSPLGYNPAWAPCWSRQDVPQSVPGPDGQLTSGHGLGYRQNVPRPGFRQQAPAGGEAANVAGPGHLGMFDLVLVRSPWPPRPDDTVIISGPRVCAGRIALLAGTA